MHKSFYRHPGFQLAILQLILFIFAAYVVVDISPRCVIDPGDAFCGSWNTWLHRYVDPFGLMGDGTGPLRGIAWQSWILGMAYSLALWLIFAWVEKGIRGKGKVSSRSKLR